MHQYNYSEKYDTIFEPKQTFDFKDVLIVPRPSRCNSRKEVSIERAITFKNGGNIYVCPVVASNMDTVGTMSMAVKLQEYNMMTCLHKHYDEETLVNFFSDKPEIWSNNVFYSVGADDKDYEKLKNVRLRLKKNGKYPHQILLCIDVANGYMANIDIIISKYRQEFPEAIICVGNVVTPEKIYDYAKAGADLVKIGLGSGGLCETRSKTGIGYPQLSAIMNCLDAAEDTGMKIMSDGGCVVPGDICKAFVAGSDFVMIGSMLAGHDECESETRIDEHGNKTVHVYGMSSTHAMNKWNGGVADYKTSEGKLANIPYRGMVAHTIRDILGGLRSCGTYINALNIQEFSNAGFIKVNNQLNNVFGD